MASNVIVQRVFAFLKQYPPFTFMENEDLKSLSSKVEVVFLQENNVLFNENDPPHDFVYVVRQGMLQLTFGEKDELMDVCDEGDIFGVRAMLSNTPYVASAKAAEESLLYAVPIDQFMKIMQKTNDVSLFFASGFASGAAVVRSTIAESNSARLKFKKREDPFNTLFEIQKIHGLKSLITAQFDDSIRDVAMIMTDRSIGSIIICDKDSKPLGIVTESDFKKKVATGEFEVNTRIGDIMTSPVQCVKDSTSISDILILMIKSNIRHLCVTETGNDDSKAIGVISERDILMNQENNPAIILKQINSSDSIESLKNLRAKANTKLRDYLEKDVSIDFIAKIISEVNDACIRKIIQLAENEMIDDLGFIPTEKYAWLALGSEGREEQLLMTDQDNALLFDNTKDEKVISWFRKFAEIVNNGLITIGFASCPAEIMAKNPKWCQSLENWKKYFSDWIRNPDPQRLMHATIFFDFRVIFGHQPFEDELRKHIFMESEKDQIYLNHLANNATMNLPPLSFFRNFIVEKNGEHENEFDIKARAMMPIADAARVLCIKNKYEGSPSTLERYKGLSQLNPKKKELFNECLMAYELLMRFRALSGLKKDDSGRYISLSELNKIERNMLRNIFSTVNDLQDYLKSEFQLQFFR